MGKNAWGFALVAVFMAVGAVAQAPSPSSSSSSDCTSAITSLSPCLSFVTTNSNETKPGNDCCTALSSIVSTKVLCLCQVLSGNNNLGLPINRTKALALPGACNVKTPPISQCAAAGAPSTSFGVPASSPALSPQTSKTPAKAPAASTLAPTKATPTPKSATPAAAPVLAPVTTVSPPLPAPTPSLSGSPEVSTPPEVSTSPAGSPLHSVSSNPSGSSPATSGPARSPGSSPSGSTAPAIFTPSTLLVLVGLALAGVQW
eukprot:PITA_23166